MSPLFCSVAPPFCGVKSALLHNFAGQRMKAPWICMANLPASSWTLHSLIRIFIKQCKLCPDKLWNNEDFAPQNHPPTHPPTVYVIHLPVPPSRRGAGCPCRGCTTSTAGPGTGPWCSVCMGSRPGLSYTGGTAILLYNPISNSITLYHTLVISVILYDTLAFIYYLKHCKCFS